MKSSWAVLFLVFQAADLQLQTTGNVACLIDRQDSCSLCPQYSEGESRLDFTHCAGDCKIEVIRNSMSQRCVPKAVNCGQKRDSDCSQCPLTGNADGGRQNMDLCQGDCQVRTMYNALYCVSKANVTTTSTTHTQEGPIGSFTNHPTSTEADVQSTTDPISLPYEPALLTVVKMEIRNTRSFWNRPLKIKFCAEICAGSRCCETGVMSQRAGIFTFSEDFQNLGTCTQFVRHPNQAVLVTAKKVGTETSQSPLRVLTITAQFDDDSLIRAENVRYGNRYPLPWGETRNMVEEESNNLPQAHCPEDLTPAANSCPKENVRVHEKIRDARKFCYYQVCTTFTADLSRVQNEELGSGGYCVPKRQWYPQYKYCCDLEQYFTLPDGNETPRPRQEINFPRCHSMNINRNDI